MRRLLYSFLLAAICLLAAPVSALAQCPMCKMSMESNLSNGGTAGSGLNKGILYLFATPYIIIGGIGYVWYRNRKRDEELEAGPEQLN